MRLDASYHLQRAGRSEGLHVEERKRFGGGATRNLARLQRGEIFGLFHGRE